MATCNVSDTMQRAARRLRSHSKSSGDGEDQVSHQLDQARAVVEDVFAEARYVIDNPSERNLADLRAALARVAP